MQAWHQAATNPQAKPTHFGCKSACRLLIHIHHLHLLLLLSLKADIHFIVDLTLLLCQQEGIQAV